MPQFRLPQNSRVRPGLAHAAPAGATRVRTFRIYRFDPEADQNPRIDSYTIDLDRCGPMVLDALIKIKNEVDTTLTFRRSCREGICGSCAMNIDGVNDLACTKSIAGIRGDVRVYPLPHLPVIKDLVPDLSNFYAQYASVKPWLQTRTPAPPDRERLQSKDDQEKMTGPRRASCAPASPPVPHTGGTATAIWGRRPCSQRTAGSSIPATRRPVNVSTTSRIPSVSTAAIRS